ncbi:MAG: SO_0444 family Cu/Zn efflux transporter [Planctomycetes bacterium]|nr:SO_0444 family Cu/Zn efflux transporter [Planctomycetota bacterium]
MNTFLDIFKEAWGVMGEMSPYINFGFLMAGVLSVYISPAFVEKHLGRGGFWSVAKASLFGIPLPLCSCGVIPVSAGLRKHGASKGATTAFLISTPQTGVESVAIAASLLGWPFAIFRVFAAFFTGLVGGALVDVVDKEQNGNGEPPRKENNCTEACCNSENPDAKKSKLYRIFHYGFVTLAGDLWSSILIGIFISGVIAAVMPKDMLGEYIGTGVLSMVLMLLFGLPLYVCASASVPIAYALLAHQGISPGAALVFLIAGPASNAASIGVVYKLLGKKSTIVYLLSVSVCAILSGLLLNHILVASESGMMHQHGAEAAWWIMTKNISAVALLAILLQRFWLPLVRPGSATHEHQHMKEGEGMILKIKGMTCSHCANSAKTALQGCAGVNSATIILERGEAIVEGSKLDPEALSAAIKEAGFEVTNISRPSAEIDSCGHDH